MIFINGIVTATLNSDINNPTLWNTYIQLSVSVEYLPAPIPNLVGSCALVDNPIEPMDSFVVTGCNVVSLSPTNLLHVQIPVLLWIATGDQVTIYYIISYNT